jgi:hypothetical protein
MFLLQSWNVDNDTIELKNELGMFYVYVNGKIERKFDNIGEARMFIRRLLK